MIEKQEKLTNNKPTKRQIAMKWWNNLSSAQKTQICDTTDFVGNARRWETLTGSEIEMIFDSTTHSIEDEIFAENKGRKGTQRSPFGMGS